MVSQSEGNSLVLQSSSSMKQGLTKEDKSDYKSLYKRALQHIQGLKKQLDFGQKQQKHLLNEQKAYYMSKLEHMRQDFEMQLRQKEKIMMDMQLKYQDLKDKHEFVIGEN